MCLLGDFRGTEEAMTECAHPHGRASYAPLQYLVPRFLADRSVVRAWRLMRSRDTWLFPPLPFHAFDPRVDIGVVLGWLAAKARPFLLGTSYRSYVE